MNQQATQTLNHTINIGTVNNNGSDQNALKTTMAVYGGG
jgi:hypothetical protein